MRIIRVAMRFWYSRIDKNFIKFVEWQELDKTLEALTPLEDYDF